MSQYPHRKSLCAHVGAWKGILCFCSALMASSSWWTSKHRSSSNPVRTTLFSVLRMSLQTRLGHIECGSSQAESRFELHLRVCSKWCNTTWNVTLIYGMLVVFSGGRGFPPGSPIKPNNTIGCPSQLRVICLWEGIWTPCEPFRLGVSIWIEKDLLKIGIGLSHNIHRARWSCASISSCIHFRHAIHAFFPSPACNRSLSGKNLKHLLKERSFFYLILS